MSNSWLQQLRRQRMRNNLKDERFACLFDPAPDKEWISLDCETSSLNPQQAEILSIAAIPVEGNRICLSHALELTVRPEHPIEAASIPIHQLRQQDVAHGLDIREAIEQLLSFIGAHPLIGYYLEFDMAVLNRQIRPLLGISLPNPAIDVSGLYYDRRVTAYRPDVDLSLDAILSDLELPDIPRHDPLNDALIAAMIFLKLQSSGHT